MSESANWIKRTQKAIKKKPTKQSNKIKKSIESNESEKGNKEEPYLGQDCKRAVCEGSVCMCRVGVGGVDDRDRHNDGR